LFTQAERAILSAIAKKGDHPAQQIIWANILLVLDQKPEGKKKTILTDAKIAERCHCDTKLVYIVSKQYAQDGLDRVLTRKKWETLLVPAVDAQVIRSTFKKVCRYPVVGYHDTRGLKKHR
jgi:hypothetical protein